MRMIATDLDGTLFGPDHRPSPRVVKAVNAARERGVHVVAVSGRSWFRGLDLATSTGARLQHFIGSNGGHRVHVESRHIEERLTFPPAFPAEMVETVSRALGPVGFGFELVDDVRWDDRFTELSPADMDGRRREPRPMDAARNAEVGKAFVAHPDLHDVDLVAAVAPLVGVDAHVTTSGAPFVELTPPGADKADAVARLAAQLGIDRTQVVAFGDNHNDLTMLEWAGLGVAMGNAIAEAKATADRTTETNDEDGVAVVLEELLSG